MRPKSSFVANFIGESNVIKAELALKEGKGIITLGEAEINLGNRIVENRPGKIQLSLRPEMFRLRTEGDVQVDIKGTISHSSYMGPVIEYLISTPIGELFTTASANETQYRAGDEIYLHLRPEELIILPDEE